MICTYQLHTHSSSRVGMTLKSCLLMRDGECAKITNWTETFQKRGNEIWNWNTNLRQWERRNPKFFSTQAHYFKEYPAIIVKDPSS